MVILFLVFSLLLAILAIVILIVRKQNFLDKQSPCRELSEEDIQAINFLERETNLSFDFGPFKKKSSDQVYCFKECSFTIHQYRMSKGPLVTSFYIQNNGQNIQVRIPQVLESKFNAGDHFQNADIEIIYRANTSWLYSIKGFVGYIDLYKQFNFLDEFSSLQLLSKRPITTEEQDIMMISKWPTLWLLVLTPLLPFGLSGILLWEPSISVIFLILYSPIFYLIWKVVIKRGKHIATREVYRLKGLVSFDQTNNQFFIGDRELKLHRKWRKALEGKRQWKDRAGIEAEIEAIMHTYGDWTSVAHQSFQPVSFKSIGITLKESDIESTRGWGMAAIYFVCLTPLLFITPIIDLAEDFFYGYRASKLTSNFSSVDEVYSSTLRHRQLVSTKGLAIPVVDTMTNGKTGEPSYSLNQDSYYFPKNQIENYQKKLNLNYIEKLNDHYEVVVQGYNLFERLRGDLSFPFYKDEVDSFVDYLSGTNEYLDKYSSYRALQAIMRDGFTLPLFESQYLIFKKEVREDLYDLTDQALSHLQEFQKGEGILFRGNEYNAPHRYKKVLQFLSKFPREEILEGVIYLDGVQSESFTVFKHDVKSKPELIRVAFQVLLWLALLLTLMFLLRLILFRLKGNYSS